MATSTPYKITAIAPVGGGGTRLYPLTLGTPKPLVPIGNNAIFQAALEGWVRQGVYRVVLAPSPETAVPLYRYFKRGEGFGSRLGIPGLEFHYTNYMDNGNADAFMHALNQYNGSDSHVLLINGDNLSDINLRDMYEAHNQSGALLTIAVKGLEQDDPRLKGFGTVVFNPDTMKVSYFVEKSPNPPSRYANTAICLFSPEIRKIMNSDKMERFITGLRKFDVGGNLIPYLVENGQKVYAFPITGAWSDIGTPHSFRDATYDILHGEYLVDYSRNYGRRGNAWVHRSNPNGFPDVEFIGSVVVGSDVKIGHGTRITDSVISDCCEIGSGVEIRGVSTVMPFARIEDGVHLTNCIVGHGTTVGREAIIRSGSVVGDDLFIPSGKIIGVDVRVAKKNNDYYERALKLYQVVNEFEYNGVPAFTFI